MLYLGIDLYSALAGGILVTNRPLSALGKLNPAQLVTKRISIKEAGKEIVAMTDYQTLGATVVNRW